MHTFDIRFSKSEGLAGLLEAPANRLGWKGSGRLSVDGQGIRIAVKRGLLTLFSRRSRRFSAESLTEAYREGDSLRLVFGNRDRRETLAVWTRGGAAAEIIKLLPTGRTVELEHSTDSSRLYRFDWRAVFTLLLLVTLVAVGAVLLIRQFGPDPGGLVGVDTPPEVQAVPGTTSVESGSTDVGSGKALTSADARPAKLSTASAPVRSGQTTRDERPMHDVEYPPGSAATELTAAASQTLTSDLPVVVEPAPYVPSRHFGSYEAEVSILRTDYYNWNGRVSSAGLRALENRWWELTVNIYYHSRMGVDYGPSLEAKTLAISRAWRNHLSVYAESLRTGDQSLLAAAQAELELAEQLAKELGW